MAGKGDGQFKYDTRRVHGKTVSFVIKLGERCMMSICVTSTKWRRPRSPEVKEESRAFRWQASVIERTDASAQKTHTGVGGRQDHLKADTPFDAALK